MTDRFALVTRGLQKRYGPRMAWLVGALIVTALFTERAEISG